MSLGNAVSFDVNNSASADVDAAVAAATGLRLMGFSCRESAGSAAVAAFNIKHSATGGAGTQIVSVELAANGSLTQWFGPQGIDVATSGLSLERAAGTFDCTLFYLTTHPGA
jgi:hypothetical protein